MPLSLRIKYKLTPPLIKLSLFLRWPTFTALVLAFSVFRIGQKSKYKVLVLRRSIFMEDVKAMAEYSSRIEYLVLNRGFLKTVFYHFLNPGEQEQVIEPVYHKSPIGAEGKRKYYEYLKRVFPVLLGLLKFDAVFAGNIGYVEHQELSKICEEEGIPFIVLHKEGLAMKARYRELAGMYRNHRFIGAKLLFYNHQVRDALLDTKVSGVEISRTAVVGVPRLDFYFHKPADSVPKQIVFFSFRPLDKFRYLEDQKELFQKAYERTAQFHQIVLEFARRHPDYSVLIKTKMAQHYFDYAKEASYGNEKFLPNVEMVNIGDSSEMIKSAAAVLGFNSMTLVEALLASRPIITPYYGDIITDGGDWDFFADHKDLVNYARSVEDLERYLIRGEYAKYPSELKNDFLRKLIAVTDGKSSEMAEGEIVKTIEEYRYAR